MDERPKLQSKNYKTQKKKFPGSPVTKTPPSNSGGVVWSLAGEHAAQCGQKITK